MNLFYRGFGPGSRVDQEQTRRSRSELQLPGSLLFTSKMRSAMRQARYGALALLVLLMVAVEMAEAYLLAPVSPTASLGVRHACRRRGHVTASSKPPSSGSGDEPGGIGSERRRRRFSSGMNNNKGGQQQPPGRGGDRGKRAAGSSTAHGSLRGALGRAHC